jgi:hypothetical protein
MSKVVRNLKSNTSLKLELHRHFAASGWQDESTDVVSDGPASHRLRAAASRQRRNAVRAGEPRGLANTAIMVTGANPGFAKRRRAQAE